MPNRDVRNIVLITLAIIGAIAILGFIGMALMSVTTGGMMNCCGGMADAWLFGLLMVVVCGRSHLALAAQIAALSRIEVYEQRLTDKRLQGA